MIECSEKEFLAHFVNLTSSVIDTLHHFQFHSKTFSMLQLQIDIMHFDNFFQKQI